MMKLRLVAACVASVATSALAQTQAPTAAEPPPEQVVQMSAFEVTTTQGHGYTSTNAASALKTNQSLMDIPQSILVVSRDLISDLGYENSTDILQYFGLSDFFSGEGLAMRGFRIIYAYEDDMPRNQSYEDNFPVDSYEIIRGPVQTFYVAATLSGIVLKDMKKPLPFNQDIITAQANDWGQYRFTGDFTGPAGSIGAAKLSYRVALVEQGGGNWALNQKDNREVIYVVGQVVLHDTTVRLSFNYQNLLGIPEGNDLITPDGKLYTGAGRTEVNFPPSMMIKEVSRSYEAQVLHKIADNWEDKFSADVWVYLVYGGIDLPSAVNYVTNTETFTPRLDNVEYPYWTVMNDFHGNYDIGFMHNTDGFGFAFSDYTPRTEVPTTASPAISGVPINSAAAINATPVPQWYQYPVAANIGTLSDAIYGEIYWMHSIDVIPKWLTLDGGWTWAYLRETSVTNLSVQPWTGTIEPFEQFLHRIGATLHLTPNVSLYAIEATALNPPSQGQVLETGLLPPPQQGTDNEIGIKTSFLGGKISTSFSWFHMTLTNVLEPGGTLANGFSYYVPVGATVQEGVDGDFAFTIVKGWQIIGSYYVGHDRDQLGNPVSNSYDNNWSLYNRYDFDRESALKGLAVGGGVVRVGGRYVTDGQVTAPAGSLPADGELKLATGTLLNAFATYQINRHMTFTLAVDNILNEVYVTGEQSAVLANPSPPRTYQIIGLYKF